jgi:hypothetical protein
VVKHSENGVIMHCSIIIIKKGIGFLTDLILDPVKGQYAGVIPPDLTRASKA